MTTFTYFILSRHRLACFAL